MLELIILLIPTAGFLWAVRGMKKARASVTRAEESEIEARTKLIELADQSIEANDRAILASDNSVRYLNRLKRIAETTKDPVIVDIAVGNEDV